MKYILELLYCIRLFIYYKPRNSEGQAKIESLRRTAKILSDATPLYRKAQLPYNLAIAALYWRISKERIKLVGETEEN